MLKRQSLFQDYYKHLSWSRLSWRLWSHSRLVYISLVFVLIFIRARHLVCLQECRKALSCWNLSNSATSCAKKRPRWCRKLQTVTRSGKNLSCYTGNNMCSVEGNYVRQLREANSHICTCICIVYTHMYCTRSRNTHTHTHAHGTGRVTQ